MMRVNNNVLDVVTKQWNISLFLAMGQISLDQPNDPVYVTVVFTSNKSSWITRESLIVSGDLY